MLASRRRSFGSTFHRGGGFVRGERSISLTAAAKLAEYFGLKLTRARKSEKT
jgi:hypothetical protein